MGRRGPAPKGEFVKSTVFTCRLQADTRSRLDAARQKSGRSLGQELEWWLQRAFKDHDRAIDHYGSDQNEAVAKFIGLVIQATGAVGRDSEGKLKADPSLWLRDPSVFDAAIAGILHVLAGFRPGGDGDHPPFGVHRTSAASSLLKEIGEAGHSVPIDKKPTRESALADLKVDLGVGHLREERSPLFEFAPNPVRYHLKEAEPTPARKKREKKK